MNAILLAGGFGKRLRPITNEIPKCLVPINNKPLIEFWIDNLKNSNIENTLINTHYLADKVTDFFKNHPLKENIHLSHEEKLLGTAGTLKKNINFFGKRQDGLLIHADNFCQEEIKNLIRSHQNRPKKCLITMMTFKTDSPSSCGIVEVDKNNIVQNFYVKEKNPPGNLANGAIYVLSKEFISNYTKSFSDAVDFSLDVLPRLNGKIFTFHTSLKLVDIGTLKNYYQLQNELRP